MYLYHIYQSKLPVRLYLNRGACSLTRTCAKKRDNTVQGLGMALLDDVTVQSSELSKIFELNFRSGKNVKIIRSGHDGQREGE